MSIAYTELLGYEVPAGDFAEKSMLFAQERIWIRTACANMGHLLSERRTQVDKGPSPGPTCVEGLPQKDFRSNKSQSKLAESRKAQIDKDIFLPCFVKSFH